MRYFLLALFLYGTASKAQDTLAHKLKFEKQFSFYSKWQMHSIYGKVQMPAVIRSLRAATTSLPTTFDTITDNPYRHGATYIALKTKTSLQNKIFLFADLYAEHRGVSYGIFSEGNKAIYPIVRVEAKDTFRLFSQNLILTGKAGQFLDEKLNEGLMVYNIDVQGFGVAASIKNWKLDYTIYGDLNEGIGLGIDDLQAYSLTYEFKKGNAGFSLVIAPPPFALMTSNSTLNLFGRKKWDHSSLYFQVAYRPYEHPWFDQNFKEQLGAVIGFEMQKKTKKLELNTKIEARYYGQLFNMDYYNLGYRYRNAADSFPQFYSNTVGKFLYPLRKFETPFNQWAVFTEFIGFNIGSLSITGNVTYELSNKFDLLAQYDINYLKGKMGELWSSDLRDVNFIYPFFDAGLRYNILKKLYVMASLSNKAMNLDIHYPTHYLLSKPAVTITMKADLD